MVSTTATSLNRMVREPDEDDNKKPKTVKRKPGKKKTLAQALKETQMPMSC